MPALFRDRYEVDEQSANALARFLEPMLDFNPGRRTSAKRLCEHEYILDEVRAVVGAIGEGSSTTQPPAEQEVGSRKSGQPLKNSSLASSQPRRAPDCTRPSTGSNTRIDSEPKAEVYPKAVCTAAGDTRVSASTNKLPTIIIETPGDVPGSVITAMYYY